MYPRLTIDLAKLRHNVRTMKQKLDQHGITLVPVTKVFLGLPEMVKIYYEEGIEMIADSRIENLERTALPLKKLLVRLPMLSQIERVVTSSDAALVSEIATIRRIDQTAQRLDKDYEMILMIDLGDLREGVLVTELDEFLSQLPDLKRARFSGIGTNLTCYGGVLPTEENLTELVACHKKLEDRLGYAVPIISGGNTSSLYLLDQGDIPPEINMLRIGEAIVLSRESAMGNTLPGMYTDVFTLEAELIEVKQKPSLPWGEIGRDAFGEVPNHEDRGLMLRGILAVGKQDVNYGYLEAPPGVELMGASSDHTIVDLKNGAYQVGDILSFQMEYGGLLQLMTSGYVEKVFR
ncbi:MAG TPA: alanine/ornithine racemase family PLP-dependent enzyme [Tissierellia bacterium]|nr:alanine/ornithine racemase family PLP-dependent enzyme [Tissierellia bacterium]